MAKIGIVGWGVVGQATGKGFSQAHDVVWHDPYKSGGLSLDELVERSEFIFICVPTPMFSDYSGTDLSIVEEVVGKVAPKIADTDKVLIIKSTVIPGTTARFAAEYPKVHFAFNPEFLTEKNPDYDFLHPDRTLIGAEMTVAGRIKALYEKIYPKDAKYFLSDSTTCELAKYASNAILSAKIILANEVYNIAQALKVDYDQVREMVQADPRIGGHLKVPGPDGDLGFGGKCLHPETKIYTTRGVAAAKNIEVGDSVLTIDGSWQEVTKKFERKVDEDMIHITGQGLGEYVLTKEHPIFAVKTGRKYNGIKRKKLTNYNGDLDLKWILSEQLEKGDFVALPKVKEGKKIFDYETMRLFGYYVAEGHIGAKNRITFGFHKNESVYVEDIEKILKLNFGLVSHRRKVGNALNLRCSSQKLACLLEENCSKYSDKKSLSKEVLLSDKRGLSEFMKGYFRGDGSKSSGIYTMATISSDLFYQLKLILLSFGVGFSTRVAEERTGEDGVKHKKAYFIRIRNYTDIKCFGEIISDKITKNLKLLRKTTFFDGDFLFIPVKKIAKRNFRGTVFNFEVKKNHTFVVSDAIVHNCFPKDLVGFLGLATALNVDLSVFEEVWKKNLALRKNRDWETIPGAVTKMANGIGRSRKLEEGSLTKELEKGKSRLKFHKSSF